MNDFIAAYFLNSPFFASVAPWAKQLDWANWPAFDDYYHALNGMNAPVQFVAQAGEQAYELQIAQSGQVPTRYANWHDYFNALCWCAFPQLKSSFNQLHQTHWSDVKRSRPRDGLTLLDESGVIVCSDDERLLHYIRTMNWSQLFVGERDYAARHLRVLLTGHGLMEKCLKPYIGMTAHAALIQVTTEELSLSDDDLRMLCDRKLSEHLLATGNLSPAELFPLPLLGIPGWWAANEEPTFYDNKQYFRDTRGRQSAARGSVTVTTKPCG